MIGSMASGFIQLHSQISQFLCVGSIVTHHIFHQCHQFFHRGMGMLVSIAVLVQIIVTVRMLMRVGMFMMVFVGMGMTVMSVLMGMYVGVLMVVLATGDMVVINVNGYFSFYSVTSSASTNRLVTWIGMGRRLTFAARKTKSSRS